jgi:DNA-binding CsgD family transcriptional regulator
MRGALEFSPTDTTVWRPHGGQCERVPPRGRRMDHLSLSEGLQETIAAIYDAAVGRQPWPAALDQVTCVLKCPLAFISWQQHDLCVAVTNRSWTSCARKGGNEECWFGWTPSTHLLRDSRVREPVQTRAIVPWSGTLQSGMGEELQDLHGDAETVGALLFLEADCAGFFGAAKPACDGRFTDAETDTLSVLLPHLDRAIGIHMRLGAAEGRSVWVEAALDRLDKLVMVVDCELNILYSNRKAQNVLAAGADLWADRNRLRVRDAKATGALLRLITRATTGGAMPRVGGAMLLQRAANRCPLSVSVVPLQEAGPRGLPWDKPSAIVFVTDPEGSDAAGEELVRTLYALTPTEASVSHLVAKGRGVKSAARIFGIAPSTVRTHLHQIFMKTGVKRQAELAYLMQRLA